MIYALSAVALAAKEVLEVEQMDALADRGYHTGAELKKCADAHITTFVAPPTKAQNKQKEAAVEQRALAKRNSSTKLTVTHTYVLQQ